MHRLGRSAVTWRGQEHCGATGQRPQTVPADQLASRIGCAPWTMPGTATASPLSTTSCGLGGPASPPLRPSTLSEERNESSAQRSDLGAELFGAPLGSTICAPGQASSRRHPIVHQSPTLCCDGESDFWIARQPASIRAATSSRCTCTQLGSEEHAWGFSRILSSPRLFEYLYG